MANKMKEETKDILRTFCLLWSAEFNCKPCSSCALYGLLWCDNKIYDNGWTLQQAIRVFGRTKMSKEDARKILEDKMNMPLEIVQMLLREIEDYEECPDV